MTSAIAPLSWKRLCGTRHLYDKKNRFKKSQKCYNSGLNDFATDTCSGKVRMSNDNVGNTDTFVTCSDMRAER